MLDLQQFCGTDESRPYLMKPFSRGEWSWACNGHILVRVPRRDDVPENSEAPDMDRVVDAAARSLLGDFVPLPQVKVTPGDERECSACDGSGREHDECDSCEHKCESCDGAGVLPPYDDTSVGIRGSIYNGRYIVMLQALPNVTIRTNPIYPAHFMFDGGEGWSMPMRGPHGTHIEAETASPEVAA